MLDAYMSSLDMSVNGAGMKLFCLYVSTAFINLISLFADSETPLPDNMVSESTPDIHLLSTPK